VHIQQWPQEMLKGITTRSPGLMWVTCGPTSSTIPIGSWPMMSPGVMYMPSTSYRCRSEPQMAVDVIRTIASVDSSIRGSGTVSTETLPVPCQVTALIDVLLEPSDVPPAVPPTPARAPAPGPV
jgi:hypothetical protein